ncbi:MAG: bi-domain-containing oxidoreductase [Syntrophothermus sp.]
MSGVAQSGKSLLKRALEQPENVSKVLDMVKNEGVEKVLHKVKNKLDAGKPTGYSISGVIVETGENVEGFKVGDRVAAAGAGLANHAEYVVVPKNLVVKIPEEVSFIEASTVTLGAIALQGVRRADLRLGEICVVVGAGILGLITVQMLRLSGVRVIAIDLDENRLKLAGELGAELSFNPKSGEDAIGIISNLTGGFGVDAVIITAATSNSEPLSQAFKMCKKKGRVILVGTVGMEINREDMYQKELDFLISTSYGPGRYDENYEFKGNDYPYAYVRWTEKRNLEEYLRLIGRKNISLDKLINRVYPIDEVTNAFDSLNAHEDRPLIVILQYKQDNLQSAEKVQKEINIIANGRKSQGKVIKVGLIGAGGFAKAVHLPNIRQLNNKYELYAVMDHTGLNAKSVADEYGAKLSTTDHSEVINNDEVDLVMISTRHDSHTKLVLEALTAGKDVFVEKPLATNAEELEAIKDFYCKNPEKSKPVLMVGFNRRFSKYAEEIKLHVDKRINPLFITYRMNAGYIPLNSWVHEAGGRIVGEACHIVDLMNFFTDSTIESVYSDCISPKTSYYSPGDNKSIVLKYTDGSVCTIEYFAVGNKLLPKEYMEVHFDNKSIIMDDYKKLTGYGVRTKNVASKTSQKGHLEELEILYKSLTGSPKVFPIKLEDIIQTTQATFLI